MSLLMSCPGRLEAMERRYFRIRAKVQPPISPRIARPLPASDPVGELSMSNSVKRGEEYHTDIRYGGLPVSLCSPEELQLKKVMNLSIRGRSTQPLVCRAESANPAYGSRVSCTSQNRSQFKRCAHFRSIRQAQVCIKCFGCLSFQPFDKQITLSGRKNNSPHDSTFD